MTRVVVAMSGGVDSSVAALLLRDAGYDVIGLFLRNGVSKPESWPLALSPSHKQGCCSVEDSRDAGCVAAALGVPYYALDFSHEFGAIIDDFVASYQVGKTPNPCVQCNRDLKFGALLRFARQFGADAVATGHYARIETSASGPTLRRARDAAKDQSYVLAAVSRDDLARAMFPLGEMTKSETRDVARRAGLPVAEKRESQEICFVPTHDYRDLLAERGVAGTPGPIRHVSGETLGAHDGFEHFTVGQRKGIRVASTEALYVHSIDAETATVVVGPKGDCVTRWLESDAFNPLVPGALGDGARPYYVQVRAHHQATPATARRSGVGVRVDFAESEPALARGQLAVLYDGDVVAGSGWIDRAG